MMTFKEYMKEAFKLDQQDDSKEQFLKNVDDTQNLAKIFRIAFEDHHEETMKFLESISRKSHRVRDILDEIKFRNDRKKDMPNTDSRSMGQHEFVPNSADSPNSSDEYPE